MKTFIENTQWYSTCWILFYVLGGFFIYVWDRQYLQGLYRWCYNATHKDPLPETVERGFVFGQKTSRKVMWALLISTIESIGTFFFTGFHSNPFVELVLWFLDIPAMLVGFGIGALLYQYWMKRRKVYEFVDKADEALEKGEFKKTVFPSRPKATPTSTEAEASKAATPSPQPAAPPEDPRETIRKFTERR